MMIGQRRSQLIAFTSLTHARLLIPLTNRLHRRTAMIGRDGRDGKNGMTFEISGPFRSAA